jgi:hypothetical protein
VVLAEDPVDRLDDGLPCLLPHVVAGQDRHERGEADHEREPLDRRLAARLTRACLQTAGEIRGQQLTADPERE